MGSILDLAKDILNEGDYNIFEHMSPHESVEETSKKLGMPVEDYKKRARDVGARVDRAIDQEIRKKYPEITETYKLEKQREYGDLIGLLIVEKNFTWDQKDGRILEIVERDTEETVGYFYHPSEEFRAFKGTRLEKVLKEYKEQKVNQTQK